jgi:hypothetical protein
MPSGMPGARVGFLGALLDWRRTEAPTGDTIAGARALEQGIMHILSITTTGRAILGLRPLDVDGLQPWVFANGNVDRGVGTES